MYADTVRGGTLLQNPWFLLSAFFVGLILLTLFGLGDSHFGYLLQPALGDPETSGFLGDIAVAFTISSIFVVNLYVISLLPFRLQVFVVWFELFLCFCAFTLLFNLSYEFIQSKIWFMITQGVFTTLYISALSIAFASVLAIFGAIAKLSGNGLAYGIATFYTSIFRGLPLLMQVLLIYKGLPQLGYVIDAVPAGVIALSLCYGAYMTEIFRAGIESIHIGQWEASRAMGFRFGLTMRKIIFPQAIPLIIPPTGNQFIAMLKDSSLVSVIGVWELTFLARTLGTRDFRHMEMLLTAAVIYWLLTVVLEVFQSRLEAHYNKRKER